MFHHFFARFANHRVGQFKKKKEKSIWRTPNVTAQFHPTCPPTNAVVRRRASTSSGTICIRPVSNFFLSRWISETASGVSEVNGEAKEGPLTQNLSSWNRWPPTLSLKRWQRGKGKGRERERRRERNPSRYRCDEKRKVRPREENGRRRVVARGGRGREVRCYPLKSRLWAVG